jgi:hypothetical protein
MKKTELITMKSKMFIMMTIFRLLFINHERSTNLDKELIQGKIDEVDLTRPRGHLKGRSHSL